MLYKFMWVITDNRTLNVLKKMPFLNGRVGMGCGGVEWIEMLQVCKFDCHRAVKNWVSIRTIEDSDFFYEENVLRICMYIDNSSVYHIW